MQPDEFARRQVSTCRFLIKGENVCGEVTIFLTYAHEITG